jgi:hypothetical protein
MNSTVIYYTSNREKPEFEARIRAKLVETILDTPLISVSHKPINFGKNICVGEHEPCDHNLYRQIQIGCEAAHTPFVTVAEADCLYPPEYFKFIPPKTDKFYRYDNLYILYKKYDYYFQKTTSECAIVVDRNLYIQYITELLKDKSYWKEPGDPPLRNIFQPNSWETFTGQYPVINIKTGQSMRRYTRTISDRSDLDTLPYWGSVSDLKRTLLVEDCNNIDTCRGSCDQTLSGAIPTI